VCLAQIKAGVITHRKSKGVQIPSIRAMVRILPSWTDAGRHWSQGVDGQGSGLAISAFDQQTEQEQSGAWGWFVYLAGVIAHALSWKTVDGADHWDTPCFT
jgi:hypothetical protein